MEKCEHGPVGIEYGSPIQDRESGTWMFGHYLVLESGEVPPPQGHKGAGAPGCAGV